MTTPKPLPPQDLLLASLDYCPDTGSLLWRISPAKHIKAGAPAGCWKMEYCSRYRSVVFNKVTYRTSRLIWRMQTGLDPLLFHVDHIDGDTTNERWDNFRLATPSESSRNRGKNRYEGTALPKGVTFHKQLGKYQAQIKVEGSKYQRYLGVFPTPEEAAAAYEKAALEKHGEFACIGQAAMDRGRK